MYNKLSVIILILLFWTCTRADDKNIVLVKPVVVKMSKFFDIFNVVGQCKYEKSRDYYADISGTLELVSEKQGGEVKKGDILLIIDKELAISIKEQAESNLKIFEDSYKRDQSLFIKKLLSKESLDKSRSSLELAKLDLARGLKTYNQYVIVAPFDGNMGIVKQNVGDDIVQGDYLFSIIGNNDIKTILFNLPESLYGKISGKDDLIIDTKGQKINSKISSISQYLSDDGTISARAIIKGNNNIVHGSYVNMEVIFNRHENIALPEQVIVKDNIGNFIYKINSDNIVKKYYVKIGARTNNLVEIISNDIKVGDLIVLEGLTKISDGKIIKIIE